MDSASKRRLARQKKQRRLRNRIKGSPERPRLCVFRSAKHIYAQIIDDDKGHTLVGVSTLSSDLKDEKSTNNVAAAKVLGKVLAEKAVAQGIKKVIFDRNGNLYHGKIKAFADAARENGLEF